MNLENKHVVITGGSKGIGAALARELSGRGCRLTLVSRPCSQLDDTAAETGAYALEADLSDLSVLNNVIARCRESHGAIDVLVNNAAIGHTRHYATLSAEDVRATLVTNLHAPMELTRQVLPEMLRRNSGAILNVASVTGEMAVPGCTVYATTKAALIMFSYNLQRDIRASDVNVSAVILGAVAGTQIYNEGIKNAVVKKLAEQLNRVSGITSQEVARRLARSLVSDKRGAIPVPVSSALPTYIRLLPIKLGDFVFSRGKPPYDPLLAEILAREEHPHVQIAGRDKEFKMN